MMEFYQLNPKKVQRYQPYMMEMLKQGKDDISENGWTNGLYVARAIGTCLSKNKKYPQTPLKLYQSAEDEVVSDAERFQAWAIAFNASYDRKSKAEEGNVESEPNQEGERESVGEYDAMPQASAPDDNNNT